MRQKNDGGIMGRLTRKRPCAAAQCGVRTYVVEIIETPRRAVEIEAGSADEALELVRAGYVQEDYVLGTGDFAGVNFAVANDPRHMGRSSGEVRS